MTLPMIATRTFCNPAPQPSAKRPWKVISDPSGLFAGRLFRSEDLKHGGGFPIGTIFEHTRTGECKQVQETGCVPLEASTAANI